MDSDIRQNDRQRCHSERSKESNSLDVRAKNQDARQFGIWEFVRGACFSAY